MKVLKIIGLIFLLFIIIASLSMFYLTKGLEEVLNVGINPVDLSGIEDGVYSGSYDLGRWANELKVTVENHKITDIQIQEDVKFAQPEESSQLFQRVIKEQNTTVDAISGATVTSKAYLKSIENALIK